MKTWLIILLIGVVTIIAFYVALHFFTKKQETKIAAQREQMKAMEQQTAILIIDKKRMKFKEAGFPAAVLENTPKYLHRTKVPVVKAKIGARIVTLLCEEKIFPLVPVKREVKATISGIYLTDVKALKGRGPLEVPTEQKKKGFFSRFKKNS